MSDPQSRNEAILQNILGAENELDNPQSRNEAILQAILNGTDYEGEPQSRIEELLIAIKNKGGGADHTIEDALIQNTAMDEYVNDRVTVVETYKFFRTKIKVIRLPNVIECANSSFGGSAQSTLEELYVPKLTRDGNYAFEGNPYLRILDVGQIRGLSSRVRANPMLSTLILRYNGVVSLNASWVAEGCPLHHDGTGGYVYVPQALLEQYRASTEWQNYANVLEFRPIEGSEYEMAGE